MSFVVAVPDLVQGAAQDLAGIRTSLAEAVAGVAGPTTGVVPAAADEVSAAIAAMFGNFGQEFQVLSSQAQGFHTEFVNLINTSAGAYLSTEVANAEQALTNSVNAPMQALFGGGVSGAASVPADSLLGGLGLGGTATGGGVAGLLPTLPVVGSLPTLPVVGSLGGVLGSLGTLGSLRSLGGITGSLGGVLGSLGNLGSLGGSLGSLVTSVLPGLPTTLGGLTNSLTGVVNSLLPGLLNIQTGVGPFFTGIAGPYEALFYNTWNNLQSLTSGWLADPFPFLRQFIANQMVYGQTIATALQTGNFAPVSAIPGHIAQNFTNVVATVTNTSITPVLDISLLPTSATIDNMVGLPIVAAVDLLGAPVSTLDAAGSSAAAFTSALQAGNAAGAVAALIDAPAVIANGFLNGQATFPYAFSLSNLTAPVGLNLGSLVNVSAVANLPLDGILAPPGYYPVTLTVTSALNPLLPPLVLDVGAGGTPFSGLLPFLINYAPQQLAQAIGAPASPPPLISLPLFTF